MPRGLVVVFAAGLVVVVAVLEGIRSNRWGDSDESRVAAARLDRVPREFGNWVGTDTPLDPKVLRVAESTGSVSRSYVSRKTRDRIDVLLLCGPTGPIGAHTPDVCYSGLGYGCVGSPGRKTLTVLSERGVSFWTARFEKKPATDAPLRVYWAWGVDGDWEASTNPRTDFALRGALFKLYVVRTDNPGDRGYDPNSDPIEAFLSEFLPVVKSALTPEPG